MAPIVTVVTATTTTTTTTTMTATVTAAAWLAAWGWEVSRRQQQRQQQQQLLEKEEEGRDPVGHRAPAIELRPMESAGAWARATSTATEMGGGAPVRRVS
ncbi:unnamed protein product [Clonostachys rosea]|uniref:Secreted protein n=1 Tax=Bionectria ochroleuca TaxID=29856 RepID=A0ABY6V363_BIOOC|nr:unnamed protein product [Clonostachys rosea]